MYIHTHCTQTLMRVKLMVVKRCVFENICLTCLGVLLRGLEEHWRTSSRSDPEPPYLPQNHSFFARKPQTSPDTVLENIEQFPTNSSIKAKDMCTRHTAVTGSM